MVFAAAQPIVSPSARNYRRLCGIRLHVGTRPAAHYSRSVMHIRLRSVVSPVRLSTRPKLSQTVAGTFATKQVKHHPLRTSGHLRRLQYGRRSLPGRNQTTQAAFRIRVGSTASAHRPQSRYASLQKVFAGVPMLSHMVRARKQQADITEEPQTSHETDCI